MKEALHAFHGVHSAHPSSSQFNQRLRPHPHLFQINTWAWLDALSEQSGQLVQLQDIPDAEWDHIQALGFDIVYLMGVWQRSIAGRHIFRTNKNGFKQFDHALPNWHIDNIVGSPFSISAYQLDPRIGDWDQLDAVRSKLHQRGMRLMLDFVPNHLGPDHPWVHTQPEYFIQGTEEDFKRDPDAYFLVERDALPALFIARGRDPYFAPWADTVQLDYFHPDARSAMIERLLEVSRHCDGLRCDMAMLILNDVFAHTWQHLLHHRPAPEKHFWEEAIPALPPEFIWMAEVYWDMEARLLDLGFSYAYDKRLYDRLSHASASEVRDHLKADIGYQQHMARFLENHDEPRSAEVFGEVSLTAFATLICTVPGLRFFHQGQMEGKTLHLPMPLNKAADERCDKWLQTMYARLLTITNAPAFHVGEWQLLEVQRDSDDSHHQLIAYRWKHASSYWLIVVNLSYYTAQGRVYFAHEFTQGVELALFDRMNDVEYQRNLEDTQHHGLYVRLEAYSVHVFQVEAKS